MPEVHEVKEETPFLNIIGEFVALGPLGRHLPYQRWLSDCFCQVKSGPVYKRIVDQIQTRVKKRISEK